MNLFYQLRTAFVFLLFLNTALFGQEFSVPVTVSDGSNSDILRIGVHPDGSETYDTGLDTLAPPVAPPGAFDARIDGTDDDYIADIRGNTAAEKTFVVKYTAQTGDGPIVLTWDNGSLAALGDFIITDNIDGLQFSLDMTTTSTLDISSATSVTNSLRILVTPQIAPVLNPISDITMDEGVTLNLGILATDANDDNIALSANNLPAFTNLSDNGNGTGTLSFAPDFEAANSYAELEIIATDDHSPALSDTVSFDLTVNNTNRAPTVNAIDNQFMDEGTILILPIFANDPDGNSILLGANNLPSFGNLSDNGNGTGSLTLTPTGADGGVYPDVTITVTDDGGLSGNAVFTLTVTDTNLAPIAAPDTTTTEEDTPISIGVLINDSDPNGEALTVTSVTQPAKGTAAIDPGETTITYTPASNFNGSDTLSYTASDGDGSQDSAKVFITITPVNDAPSITLPDVITFGADDSLTLDIWDAVSDPESADADLSYDFSASPDTLNLAYDTATGILLITPRDTANNNISELTVTVDDLAGGVSAATINVIIDPPLSVAAAINTATLPDSPVLMQNYPNPFNPVTLIRYSLPEAMHIKIGIYNSFGQQVRTLTNRHSVAGYHNILWDGKDSRGVRVASGFYLYVLKAGDFSQSRKMLLLR